jgi:hypothetical protein
VIQDGGGEETAEIGLAADRRLGFGAYLREDRIDGLANRKNLGGDLHGRLLGVHFRGICGNRWELNRAFKVYPAKFAADFAKRICVFKEFRAFPGASEAGKASK